MNDMRPHSALLEALQREDSPSPADASRVRDRVMLQVGLSAAAVAAASGLSQTSAAAGTAAAGSAATTFGAVSSFSALKALLLVGGLAGAVAGTAVLLAEPHNSGSSQAIAPTAATTNQVPLARVSATEEQEAEVLPIESVKEAEVVPASAPIGKESRAAQVAPRVQVSSKVAPSEPSSHLAAEAQLLSRAQAALQKGQSQLAIAALNEHSRKFPQGVLRGEREAALTLAYCQSGDLVRGQTRAKHFVSKNPQSPMVQRLISVCKL